MLKRYWQIQGIESVRPKEINRAVEHADEAEQAIRLSRDVEDELREWASFS
jgi:hypothetical protein